MLGLTSCKTGPPVIGVELADSVAGVVLVQGVREGVTIRGGAGMPPLAGRYDTVGTGLRFTPRFPPEGISALVVTASGREWTLLLAPRAVPERSTRVTAIHPSAPVLPANQLRWYITFSAPMREGMAKEHVRLRAADGTIVEKAFLDIAEELWDPSRTRLTLMFDMGRVKNGLRKREDLGAVLEAGQRYALEIDGDWLDARGAALVTDTTHRFVATAERYAALDPARWSVSRTATGERRPLRIEFGVPLDHALAERLIMITSADGERVGGASRLVDHDRALEFTPTSPWSETGYQLRVHPALEDVAGNRVAHPFDASIQKGESAGVGSEEIVIAVSASQPEH